MTSGRRDVKFGYTKFADFFDNDRQTFDQLSATFRQFKNWPNWIVSTSVSQHVPELLELLTNKLKRDKGHQRFQKGYNFSREQVFVLVSDQRICQSRSRIPPKEGGNEAGEVNICQISNIILDGETIESIAQRIIRDNLGEKEVKAIVKALTITPLTLSPPHPVLVDSEESCGD